MGGAMVKRGPGRQRVAATVACVAIAAFVAACGGDDSSASGPTTGGRDDAAGDPAPNAPTTPREMLIGAAADGSFYVDSVTLV